MAELKQANVAVQPNPIPGSLPGESEADYNARMVAAAAGSTFQATENVDGQKVTTGDRLAVGDTPAAGAPAAAPAVTPRPADIPEKFWDAAKGEVNVAALLKSQQDGEAALRGNAPAPAADPAAPVADPAAPAPADAVSDTQAPVVANASAEYAEKGELSTETYAALEGVGLSQDMVQTYIAGQQAIVTQLEGAIYGPFEGKDGYEAAADWAADNLTDDEIKALDVQITSVNPAIAAQGAKALAEKYEANRDIDPNVVVSGSGNAAPSGGAYNSSAEMQKDMADPKYKTDPAFRNAVAQKIARSRADLLG
jgi:hypothetical protein